MKNCKFFSDSFQSDLLQPAFNIFTIFVYEIGFLKSVQQYTWQFSIVIFYICFIFFLFLVLLFLFSGEYVLFSFEVSTKGKSSPFLPFPLENKKVGVKKM